MEDYKVGDRVEVMYGTKVWDGPGTVVEATRSDGITVVQPDHRPKGDTGGFELETLRPLKGPSDEEIAATLASIENARHTPEVP